MYKQPISPMVTHGLSSFDTPLITRGSTDTIAIVVHLLIWQLDIAIAT